MILKNPIEIPRSHRNEWASKRNFESLIDQYGMYMPFGWSMRDYGIDGQIEITSTIKGSDSFRPDGKYFLIQLKSTETIKVIGSSISFSVPVRKIIQWYSGNLPLMFVLNDLKISNFYTIWIDEDLINTIENSNSNWTVQNSVTLKIPIVNNFNNFTLQSIKDYVLNWKIPTRKIIQPGTYFDIKDKCNEYLDSYSSLSSPFAFESVNNSIKRLDNQIEKAIYRIAITGLSRVGKSSLINALLKKRDISPTGVFQTTGVPIQIVPSKEDFVKITLLNGQVLTEKFSKTIIENYASQNKNEDNKKGVELITIHLANRQLEKGVSFFDIPGLDDPDDNIYSYTWSTVSKANAILYLIDASPFEHGGYIFRHFSHQATSLIVSLFCF